MEDSLQAQIESFLERYTKTLQGTKNLIGMLLAMQEEFGYLPKVGLLLVAEKLGITKANVFGVASFYNHFRFVPPGDYPIKMCMGTACHIKQAAKVLEQWERRLNIKIGEVTADRKYSLDRVDCVGCCAMAPVAVIGKEVVGAMSPTKVDGLLLKHRIQEEESAKESREALSKEDPSSTEKHSTPSSQPGHLVFSVKIDLEKARAAYEALRSESRIRREALWGDSAFTVMVGTATCGRSAGALPVRDAFREQIQKEGMEATVIEVGCLGHCYAEPMAFLKRPGYPALLYQGLNPVIARSLVDRFFLKGDPLPEYLLGALEPNAMGLPTLSDLPRYGLEHRRLLRYAGLYDPADIRQAIALGVYQGVFRALELGPEKTLQALKQAGLRGMGGAGR